MIANCRSIYGDCFVVHSPSAWTTRTEGPPPPSARTRTRPPYSPKWPCELPSKCCPRRCPPQATAYLRTAHKGTKKNRFSNWETASFCSTDTTSNKQRGSGKQEKKGCGENGVASTTYSQRAITTCPIPHHKQRTAWLRRTEAYLMRTTRGRHLHCTVLDCMHTLC